MTDINDIMAPENPGAEIDNDAVDGRTMRRTRNRTAVINALLELIHEGEFEPGASTIAQRAGVSHRSVFRYFDDLGDLVRTAVSQEFEQAEKLADVESLGVGSLEDRIERYVASRIRLWRFVHDAAILAQIKSMSIPNIDEAFIRILETFREQVEAHFDRELSALGNDVRVHVTDMILVMSSHDAYSYHLRMFKHSDSEINLSWRTSLAQLLTD
jgi:AcrR family transcriptional regulator